MAQNRMMLLTAAAVGLIGVGVWRTGTPLGAAALLVGACLLFAAAALFGIKEPLVAGFRRKREWKRDAKAFHRIVDTKGWTVEPELDEPTARTLHAGEQTLLHLRGIASGIEDDEAARTIGELCSLGEAIFAKIRRHPERLSSVQRFFDYHLPATGSIMDKYMTFVESDVYTNEMEYQVKQIEGLLGRIRRHFRKHLERLMRDDLLDAEIEVNAFDRVMRSEGL